MLIVMLSCCCGRSESDLSVLARTWGGRLLVWWVCSPTRRKPKKVFLTASDVVVESEGWIQSEKTSRVGAGKLYYVSRATSFF